ncbi:hypothetical protein DFR26_2142 [Paraperlucidibaca baekdonensis]|uniref:Uncharacterized protein n=1 Tax=Paraperlucidibaca baekdonensis TaxID=748120 RepID=A0A3E0H299_9GAMM|nr:hypothetical protein DFR26_2142 [Paraperlucidibaca baekdonensis]
MITVHTSIIDSELNHAEIARHFDFIAIEFNEPRNERIQALRVCRILCNRDFGYCRGSLSA